MKAKRTKQTPKGKKSETFTIKEDNITAAKLITAIRNGDIDSVARLESKSTRAPTSSRTGANKPASIAQRNPAGPRARQVAVTSNVSINSANSGARRKELNPTAPPYHPMTSRDTNSIGFVSESSQPHPSTNSTMSIEHTTATGSSHPDIPPTQFALELFQALQYPPTKELFHNMIKTATNTRIDQLTSDVSELTREVKDLRRELELLKQYGRRNALRIYNPRWPAVRDENTDALIVNLAQEVLKVPLNASDISRSHHVGRPSPHTPRPILVKFTSYRSRERIYKARQIGAAFDISINEDLTQATAYLAYNAREAKRSGLLVDTRTMDGKVFVRAPAEERSTIVGDLDELEKYLHRQNERPQPASYPTNQNRHAGQPRRPPHPYQQPRHPPNTYQQGPRAQSMNTPPPVAHPSPSTLSRPRLPLNVPPNTPYYTPLGVPPNHRPQSTAVQPVPRFVPPTPQSSPRAGTQHHDVIQGLRTPPPATLQAATNQVLSPTHGEIPHNAQGQSTIRHREPPPQRDDNSTMSKTPSEHPKPTSEPVRPETVRTPIDDTSNLTSKDQPTSNHMDSLSDIQIA